MRSAIAVFVLFLALIAPVLASDDAPVNNSLIAFTIPEKDLLPESVAYDPVEEAFYVGSTRKGKIVKVDKRGNIADFIAPRQDGLWMIIGMKIDSRNRTLWVNSSGGGNLIGYNESSERPAGVFKFDLKTGNLIKKYLLDKPGEEHFFNDLVISSNGDVFVTHMFNDSVVYKIPRDGDALEVFAKSEGFTEPNGITFSDNGRTLFVAHDEGISTFDPKTGARRQLSHPEGVSLKGVDGLYFYRNSLVAIHPGRKLVARYYLDESHGSVARAETIESRHPMFNNPTTGVIVGDTFYYVANAQFGSFNKDGSLFPMERLFEVVILKVKLDGGQSWSSGVDEQSGARFETVATNLEVPWSIDFAPDGRIFITERPGRIRVIENGRLREKPWAELNVVHEAGSGLMGLAVAPNFSETGHVYAMGTFRAKDGSLENRIYRFTERDGKGTEPRLIVGELPSARVHGGGEISFGLDGMLYATMGDAMNIKAVQDMKSLVGKVLRYCPDGSIPADNPFPGSPVYSLGVRNPQGIDWHPETGDMFATEHGPSNFPEEGGREDQDELNVIVRGGNYGWPDVSGMREDERFIKPLVEWTPAIAPGGLAFLKAKNSRRYGDVFVGGLRGQHLRRIKVEPASGERASWRMVEEEALFHKQLGRIRAVAMGPDGYIYFSNSNRDSDGKELGLATPQDDRIFRLRID